jgi:predicted RNA binding protein YcfA (HicA-like mRNA interferase family)
VSSAEDLVNKFLKDQTHITIDDCDQLLAINGYKLKKGSGSHRVYHKKNARAITIVAPHGSKYIKFVYIKLVLKLLGLEE